MVELSVQEEADDDHYDKIALKEQIEEQKKLIETLKTTIKIYAPYITFPNE